MLQVRLIFNLIAICVLWAANGAKEVVGQNTTTSASTNSTITSANITAMNAATSSFPTQKQEEALRSSKSKEILSYLNLSANPCEDFYEFACGNWNRVHTPSKQNEEITQDTLLEDKINKDLQHLLDESFTTDDSTTARKVKVFYKSCLDARRNEEQQQEFLKDFIKNNGGFPAAPGSNWLVQYHNYNWQHIVAGLRYNYGFDILIGMDIDINYQNVNENSIYLMEPATLIPRHLCSQKVTQSIEVTDRIYDPIEQEVADNLKLWLTLKPEDSLKLAADIVTFEYDLCTAMYANETEEEEFTSGRLHENVQKKYARKSLLEFNHLYNNTIDFNAIARDSFGIPINKPVFMKSPSYFEHLVKVIDEYNEYNRMVVPNYIMYRAMAYITLPLYDAPLNRSAYCLPVVKKYFPKVLGDMYHRRYADNVYQVEVTDMFAKLKDEFHMSLQQEWIEKDTARLGKSKLSELQLHISAYEKDFLSLDFERSNYWKNLKLIMAHVRTQDVARIFATGSPFLKDEVEAYETRVAYRPHHKHIDMGWGGMQPPYFHSQLPNAMRYAGLGQKLAQSMATVFDDNNWMSDIKGHNNWDPQTAREYYRRANCFHEQIGYYLSNQPHSFNQVSKTRQIMAKSAGLNVAFNAYIDWLRYQHPINDQATLYKETLTHLDFTNTQLFFITFAQLQCKSQQKVKKSGRKIVISPLTNHTLTRYEVNGPLRNFNEFAREFRCPLGSEMSVADKCVTY